MKVIWIYVFDIIFLILIDDIIYMYLNKYNCLIDWIGYNIFIDLGILLNKIKVFYIYVVLLIFYVNWLWLM